MPSETLEKILKKVVKSLKKKSLTEEAVKDIWKEAAGPGAARHSRPTSLRRSTLFVNVDDSGWLYNLATKKKDLAAAVSARLEGKKVKDIRLRIGDVKGTVKDERKKG